MEVYSEGTDRSLSAEIEGGFIQILDASKINRVAGAGKECCYSASNLDNKNNPGLPLFRMDSGKNKGDGGGFASYEVSASGTQIRFHKASGQVQYTPAVIAPRNKLVLTFGEAVEESKP